MYSWNQLRPCGFAARTSSIDVVPIVDSENGMPYRPATRAPATSPSVCIIRVNPVGAIPNGSATGPPRTSRSVVTSATSRSTFGWNSMSSNA